MSSPPPLSCTSTGYPFVGTATHFLSYAWRYDWNTVFTALEAFERKQAEAGEQPSFFFIDQLSLDQHKMTSVGLLSKEEKQAQVVEALRRSIEVPGRVLVLLHPWDRPIVLSRAWCLVSGRSMHSDEDELSLCREPNLQPPV